MCGRCSTAIDDKFAVFGSGDEVRSISIPRSCPPCREAGCATISSSPTDTKKTWTSTLPRRTRRAAAIPAHGRSIRIPKKIVPLDDAHVNYLLEYNTRFMSGNEQRGYWFDYGDKNGK